jgi:hypothetical protein
MRYRLHLPAVLGLSLITSDALAQLTGAGAGAGGGAAAQAPGAITTNPGSAGISSAPGGPSTSTTGIGSGATTGMGSPGAVGSNQLHNQRGVPNTSTPGSIGTGASSSGLPGDDPAHPGFPDASGSNRR